MKLKALVAVIAFTVMGQASAGLLIDPYVGYGQTKTTFDLVTSNDDTNSTTAMGSRLGYSFLLFSAGIDYSIANSEYEDETTKATNMSAFVGFDLPILLRAWAEYFISSDLDIDNATGDMNFKDGYGVGLGFTGLPFVSINLELDFLNYEYEVGAAKADVSAASTLLSVSLPLDL